MQALALDESQPEASSGAWSTGLSQAEVAGYRSLLELGHGGMGSAWLAVTQGATDFERLIVIKRLRAEWALDSSAVGRFLEEARTAASVHHSNVVGIHQVGRDAEGPFLVLDYIEGATLGQLLDRNRVAGRRVPVGVVLRVALDMARGLRAIHSAVDPRGRELNILHRDVTLQNILIGVDGVTRIADFGIAKSLLASVNTNKNDLIGKLLYLPPEYLQRQPCDQRLDVYSLGLNLWIALAGGKRPWRTHSTVQLAWNICENGVPSLLTVVPDLAPELDQLVLRACDRDPARRFQTGTELVEALEGLGKQLGLATHDEVARAVESAVGPALERRRELVAKRISAARSELEAAQDATEEPEGASDTPAVSAGAAAADAGDALSVQQSEAVTQVVSDEDQPAELTASKPFPLAVLKTEAREPERSTEDTPAELQSPARELEPSARPGAQRAVLWALLGALIALLLVGFGAALGAWTK